MVHMKCCRLHFPWADTASVVSTGRVHDEKYGYWCFITIIIIIQSSWVPKRKADTPREASGGWALPVINMDLWSCCEASKGCLQKCMTTGNMWTSQSCTTNVQVRGCCIFACLPHHIDIKETRKTKGDPQAGHLLRNIMALPIHWVVLLINISSSHKRVHTIVCVCSLP